MTAQDTNIDEFDEEFVDELKPGTTLLHGQYTIESFLAAGGFGITYLARDSLNRVVVIKECFPGSFCRRSNASVMPRSRAHQNELAFIVKLFSQEAKSLSKAGHPNVVGVHQVFEENNTAYMALDFVEGQDLLEIITEGGHDLTPEKIQTYLKKVVSAIGHVHRKGILHRDISPDNIIISQDGEPVLIDFGAARENADEKASRMLSALRVVKDGYSPQEFYIAGSEQDESCDLYSLAASFYHIITGELPPDSQSRLTAFAANEPDPCVPLVDRAKGYPKAFCEALDKAMSVLPKHRMRSADEWLAAMETGVSRPKSRISIAQKSTAVVGEKKSFMPILLGTTALAAVVGVGFFVMSGGEGDVTPPTNAPEQVAAPAPAFQPNETPVDTATPTAEPAPTGAPAPAAVETAEVENVIPTTPPAVPTTTTDLIAAPSADNQPVLPETVTSDVAARSTVDLANQPDVDNGQFAVPSPVEPAPVEPEPAQDTAAVEGAQQLPEGVTFVETPAAEQDQLATAPTDPSLENLVVNTNWSVRLPFGADPNNPKAVGDVIFVGWDWLKSGTEIIAVNGMEIPGITAIQTALRESTDLGDKTQLEIKFATGKDDNGDLVEHSIILPVVQHSVLGDGTKLDTVFRDNRWQTIVMDVPAGSDTTLRAGDVVISYTPTGAEFNERTSVRDIVQAERRSGATEIPVMALRDGALQIGSFVLPDLLAESAAAAPVEDAVANLPEGMEIISEAPSVEASVEVFETTSVIEQTTPLLPFDVTLDGTLKVSSVDVGAPLWLARGLTILSVNGRAVSSDEAFFDAIDDAAETAVNGSVLLRFGVEARLSQSAIDRTIEVPLQTKTTLLNGLAFETQVIDGQSVLKVADAPAGSNFRAGDTLVAYMATGEQLDGSINFKSLLERELAAGTSTFSFAINRQGEMWIEAFNLAALNP